MREILCVILFYLLCQISPEKYERQMGDVRGNILETGCHSTLPTA